MSLGIYIYIYFTVTDSGFVIVRENWLYRYLQYVLSSMHY